jgi:hypothetical protein
MTNLTFTLIIGFVMTSCDPVADYSFDAPFPKSNKNLSLLLGENLTLKTIDGETLRTSISSTNKSNLIINQKTLDTLFFGKVSKSKGLLYFSSQLDSGKFWIHAVKINGDKIYGLDDNWEQMDFLSKRIEEGNYEELVKEKSEKKVILHPNKAAMKKLFSSFLDSLPPLTIIQRNQLNQIVANSQKMAATSEIKPGNRFSFKGYPNPVKDYLHLEFDKEGNYEYKVVDLNGACSLKGNLFDEEEELNLQTLNQGNYILTLKDTFTGETSHLRIIKN